MRSVSVFTEHRPLLNEDPSFVCQHLLNNVNILKPLLISDLKEEDSNELSPPVSVKNPIMDFNH